MGVFYHLRYPLLALDILSHCCSNWFIFQSLTMPGKGELEPDGDYQIHQREKMMEEGWPKMVFIEHKLNGDPTNWWAPNAAAIRSLLRSSGMKVVAEPAHETIIARKHEYSVSESWNQSEYFSATGRNWKGSIDQKVKGKSI